MGTMRGMANGKAIKVAALLVVLALIAGMSPVRARAAQAEGVFESETYGVTFTWDDAIWTGNEADLKNGEGVELESLGSFGALNVGEGEYTTSDDCLQNMEDFFGNNETYGDFGPASRRMERPEGTEGGSGELYTYTYVDDTSGDSLDMAVYLECNVLPGETSAVNIFLSTDQQSYADELESWNDLIGGIDFGGGTGGTGSTKGSTKGDSGTGKGATKTGIKGDTYTNVELSFTLSWDEEFWTATELDSDDGQGVELDAGSSYAYILGVPSDEELSVDDCIEILAGNLENNESFSRVRVASSSIERPELARKAAGELYTFTSEGDKMVAYVECRPLADGGVLTVQLASTLDGYETDLEQWQSVLVSIDLKAGGAPSGSTKGDDTDKPSTGTTKGSNKGDKGDKGSKGDDTDKPADKGGDEPVVGNASVAGATYGVEIAYDDAVWTPTDNSAQGVDQIDFASDYGRVSVISLAATPDLAGCVQTLADTQAQYTTDGLSPAPRSLDRPKAARGAEAELFAMTMNTDSGAIDAVYYVECRELGNGEGLVAITFLTLPTVYVVALPAFDGLLAGIDA